MQLYVSDFVGDTLSLSSEQVGVYLLLLMAMWNADGELPNDAVKLARVARVDAGRWSEVWSDLAPFFVVEPSKITHSRLTKELARFARKSAARSEAGKRGAEAKALKNKETPQAIAGGLLKHSPETRIKKRARGFSPSEDSVQLDRYRDEHLFKACEQLTKPVPSYMQRQSFPSEIVAQARSLLSSGGVSH